MSGKSELDTLLLLLKKGAHERGVEVSLNELSKEIGSSKQTAARRLERLQKQGLIHKTYGPKGQTVGLTAGGLAELKAIYIDMERTFKKGLVKIRFSGRVTTGLGEGSYYMRQAPYVEKFRKELGYVPYPGTLDVRLDAEALEARETLIKMPGRVIEGFKSKDRAFGRVKFFPAKMKGVDGAIILPSRSTHLDVLEFISSKNLRKTLKLRDGSRVELEVEL